MKKVIAVLFFAFIYVGFVSAVDNSFVKLKEAAEAGDAKAQYLLGRMYETGDAVKQNYKEAIKWFKKASEQGMAQAKCELGKLYLYGEGVKKDLKKAKDLFVEAAEQGHETASKLLKELKELHEDKNN